MELRPPARCLVVLVGPSASGKSTWAAATFHQTEIVPSDRLRGMVAWATMISRASKAAFSLLDQIVPSG